MRLKTCPYGSFEKVCIIPSVPRPRHLKTLSGAVTMKGHSCLTCTRRKVRCDRDEPCSNCKRRKQDKCVYPDTSPNDRIKRLEILVRSLGGDPEDGAFASSTNPETSTPAVQAPTSNSNSEARPLFPADNEPVIEDCNGDGQKTYLESYVV